MKTCSVCESANLNSFDCDAAGGHYPIWWCEDCGSLHKGSNRGEPVTTWQPEKTLLQNQVRVFHKKFSLPIGDKPHVPDAELVRFRLNLIAEEFFELLEAAGLKAPGYETCEINHHEPLEFLPRDMILADIREGDINVDLPAFVDATLDLDYVVEGTRDTFGVKTKPLADEVQRANMDKVPAPTGNRYGGQGAEIIRPTKPPGWKPPDIEGELRKQGWVAGCDCGGEVVNQFKVKHRRGCLIPGPHNDPLEKKP